MSATASPTDLALIANGCGISNTCTVSTEADFDKGSALLRNSDGPTFVLLEVSDEPPPNHKRNFDGVEGKIAFRKYSLKDTD